jgi:predicted transposase YdaD
LHFEAFWILVFWIRNTQLIKSIQKRREEGREGGRREGKKRKERNSKSEALQVSQSFF